MIRVHTQRAKYVKLLEFIHFHVCFPLASISNLSRDSPIFLDLIPLSLIFYGKLIQELLMCDQGSNYNGRCKTQQTPAVFSSR